LNPSSLSDQVTEKSYHSVLIVPKSKIDFDCSCQLHIIDLAEEERDMSWEYSKMFKCSKYRRYIGNYHHN
jgi:hypothetical protein